jgi:hypothetical protein
VFSKFWQPCRPLGRALHDDQCCNPPRDGNRVPAKSVLSHPGFEEGNSRAPRYLLLLSLSPVKLGKRVVHRPRTAIEVLALAPARFG